MASANKGRITKAQAATYQRYQAYTASLTSEQFREHALRVLKGVSPAQAADSMREYGYTEAMIETALQYIYGGDTSLVRRPRG